MLDTDSTNDAHISALTKLKDLLEQGFIDSEEYHQRKRQIIDQATGTSSFKVHLESLRKTVIPHSHSSRVFDDIVQEKAIKHIFDLQSRRWRKEVIYVKVDPVPFAKGGLRLVYHLQEFNIGDDESICYPTEDETFMARGPEVTVDPDFLVRSQTTIMTTTTKTVTTTELVAKHAIKSGASPETYFRDVEMQAHCAYYAKLYNKYSPPRKVKFCDAWLIELTDRSKRPLLHVEPFISSPTQFFSESDASDEEGEVLFTKHNNNYGYVSEDLRNTPQTFSHFSFEASCRTLIVVDIQGVGDMYTDPQVHTLDGKDFGRGNLGQKGMKKFLQTHQCNSICKYLKLPAVNPKADAPHATRPNFPLMRQRKVSSEAFREGHYYEREPHVKNILRNRARRKARMVEVIEEEEPSCLETFCTPS